MHERIITFAIGILAGIFSIYLGIKGRKWKKEREMDRNIPADYLPGAHEGAVEKGWLMFILAGLFCILIAIIDLITGAFS